MKKIKIYEILFISIIAYFPLLSFSEVPNDKSCFQKNEYSNDFGRDIVSDEDVAKKIAEAVLTSIYGIDAIERQKPFFVVLENNIWIVTGYLSKNMLGGTFSISISKRDGRIIKVNHGK